MLIIITNITVGNIVASALQKGDRIIYRLPPSGELNGACAGEAFSCTSVAGGVDAGDGAEKEAAT